MWGAPFLGAENQPWSIEMVGCHPTSCRIDFQLVELTRQMEPVREPVRELRALGQQVLAVRQLSEVDFSSISVQYSSPRPSMHPYQIAHDGHGDM